MKKILIVFALFLSSVSLFAQYVYPEPAMLFSRQLCIEPNWVSLNGVMDVNDGWRYVRLEDGKIYFLMLPRMGGLTLEKQNVSKIIVKGFVIGKDKISVTELIVDGVYTFERTEPLMKINF